MQTGPQRVKAGLKERHDSKLESNGLLSAIVLAPTEMSMKSTDRRETESNAIQMNRFTDLSIG
jgi:hypothetical protein